MDRFKKNYFVSLRSPYFFFFFIILYNMYFIMHALLKAKEYKTKTKTKKKARFFFLISVLV